MNDSTSASSVDAGRPRALQAIVFGGLAVGVLDILDAMIFFGIRNGARPVRILQSIAAGVYGREASLNGGWKTAALGLVLHFFIATVLATIYYLGSLALPILIRYAVICGMAYGVAVFFVMNRIVVPLSAIGPARGPMPWGPFLNGVIGHALLVGLPIALIARWSAKTNQK